MSNTTWRKELSQAMSDNKDEGPVIKYAPNEAAFNVSFYGGFGGPQGPHVLAWTERFVYFPVVYDGSEWIGSAPRNPQDDGQAHVGSE